MKKDFGGYLKTKKMLNEFVHMPCELRIGEATLKADNLVEMCRIIVNILREWRPHTDKDKTATKDRRIDTDKRKYITRNGETYRRGVY